MKECLSNVLLCNHYRGYKKDVELFANALKAKLISHAATAK